MTQIETNDLWREIDSLWPDADFDAEDEKMLSLFRKGMAVWPYALAIEAVRDHRLHCSWKRPNLGKIVNTLESRHPGAMRKANVQKEERKQDSTADVFRKTQPWLANVAQGAAGDAEVIMRKHRQDFHLSQSPPNGPMRQRCFMAIGGALVELGVRPQHAERWAAFALDSPPQDMRQSLEDLRANGGIALVAQCEQKALANAAGIESGFF